MSAWRRLARPLRRTAGRAVRAALRAPRSARRRLSRIVPLLARARRRGPRVLVVDDRVPDVSRGVGYPRAYALLHALASLGYRVTLFPYGDAAPYEPWLGALERAGVEVMIGHQGFEGFAAARAGSYAVAIVSRPFNFRPVRPLLGRYFPDATVVYDAEALFFLREKRKAEVDGVAWTGQAAEREELALLRQADLVVTVSSPEARLVTQALPELAGRVHVWGHPVQPRPTPRPFADRKDLLFVGSFQSRPSPNEDAARHFIAEVLPLVRASVGCVLRVVGHGAPVALEGCASEAVEITGRVDDLGRWYDAARVFVVPHLYAAGIPLKLCEAMARGIPAVVSELIAGQLGVEHGREVLVGREPREFAGHVVRLYQDRDLWMRLRREALAFVRQRHDPQRLQADLAGLMTAATSPAARRTAVVHSGPE